MTQNVNECLNGLIWDRCPKATYVEQETVALAAHLAVPKFNNGDISILKILTGLDIAAAIFPSKGAEDCDNARIKLSAKKVTEKVKQRGKTLRHARKHYIDTVEENERVTYEPGAF